MGHRRALAHLDLGVLAVLPLRSVSYRVVRPASVPALTEPPASASRDPPGRRFAGDGPGSASSAFRLVGVATRRAVAVPFFAAGLLAETLFCCKQ